MIRDAIKLVVEKRDLGVDEAHAVMSEMMDGLATPSQIASFITAMRMKGETEDELVGFASAMREKATKIRAPGDAVDLCGTGGDGMNTFNVSTAASFVAAAAGVPVAKHGNRSVSSRCGSADVLAALGIPVDLGPEEASKCLFSTGLCFMFAPVFHASMRNVVGPRRELGIRTFFNMLGPMTNPAGVRSQLIGVYDFSIARKMARTLRRLGSSKVMIVNGSGMDEITNTGPTKVMESSGDSMIEYDLSPEMFQMEPARIEDIGGGDSRANARAMASVLRGERSPRADIVALNAGAALYVADRAGSVQDGVAAAKEIISSGRAYEKLKQFADVSRALEAERQMRQDPRELLQRRVMPQVLVSRSADISSALLAQISGAGLADGLRPLDQKLLSSPNVLTAIALRRIISASRQALPESTTKMNPRRSLIDAIESASGIAIIAEYKPDSPSAPALYVPPEPELVAETYGRSGAAAVSVLVEPDFFSGSSELFSSFRGALDVPMLFKDFVVSEKQIRLASALGADSILLIAKALDPDALDRFIGLSLAEKMEPLVEVHDGLDIDKLKACTNAKSVRIVGINSRDLRTMATDLSRVNALRALLPSSVVAVAESGISSPDDIGRLDGFKAVLIGSALMASHDLVADLERYTAACRRLAT